MGEGCLKNPISSDEPILAKSSLTVNLANIGSPQNTRVSDAPNRSLCFTGKPVGESKAEAPFNKANRTLCFRVEQLLVNCIKQMPDLFPIINVKLFFMSTFRVDNPSELTFADFQKDCGSR